MDTTETNNSKVIAYEPDGVKIFNTINEAARYYGMSWMTVFCRIKDGEETDGIGFNWFDE